MERGEKLKNAVVLCHKMKKIRQKEAGYIIFNHQNVRNGEAPIKLYYIEEWIQIITEVDRHLVFDNETLE